MVREEWLCTGRVPAQRFGASGTDPPDVWFSIAAVGGKEAHDAVRAVAVGLGCSGGGTTAGTNAVLHNRIGGQESAQPGMCQVPGHSVQPVIRRSFTVVCWMPPATPGRGPL